MVVYARLVLACPANLAIVRSGTNALCNVGSANSESFRKRNPLSPSLSFLLLLARPQYQVVCCGQALQVDK